jgi:hypothetical protein
LKLEFASEVARGRFQIAPATITALNQYLGAASTTTGLLTGIMREQARLHIQWRLARRVSSNASLESSGSFARASTFDQNDLHSANLEFESEIAAFGTWRAGKGKDFVPKLQSAGFNGAHELEWEEIATWWGKALPPPESVLSFFDEYVHDSRAWFKLIPGKPDNEEGVRAQLKDWVAKRQSEREQSAREEKIFLDDQRSSFRLVGRKHDVNASKYVPRKGTLTDAQRNAADEYARTNKIPRMVTEGREPFEFGPVEGKAGYLRFRRIYAGGDSELTAKNEHVEPDSSYAV